MFSVFLSSYRNTRESLGELKKAAALDTWQPIDVCRSSIHNTMDIFLPRHLCVT